MVVGDETLKILGDDFIKFDRQSQPKSSFEIIIDRSNPTWILFPKTKRHRFLRANGEFLLAAAKTKLRCIDKKDLVYLEMCVCVYYLLDVNVERKKSFRKWFIINLNKTNLWNYESERCLFLKKRLEGRNEPSNDFSKIFTDTHRHYR